MGIVINVPAVSPAQWGAQVNYDSKTWTPWNPDKFVLHWGGPPGVSDGAVAGSETAERAQLRSYENFHLSLGWLGIAYNWAIGNSGTLYRLRGNNRSGATSGDYEKDGIPENHEAVAVLFIVGEKHGKPQPASSAAFATFRELYAQVPQLDLVIGHRDASGPGYECPGPQIYQWIQDGGYQGGNNVYALPADPTSDPKSINLFQRLLNDAHGAGLTADGVWGPETSAAVAAVVGGDGDSLNPFQAKEFIKSLHFAWGPEILHGNDSHSTDYAAADHTHGGAGHNHDTKYAKADHVHDEGVTGPPQ